MVWETIQIAATKPAPIKVEILGVRAGFFDPNLKLREEIFTQLVGYGIVPPQNLVQVGLNSPVKSSFHAGGARQQAGRK